jgi:hypothetical protein
VHCLSSVSQSPMLNPVLFHFRDARRDCVLEEFRDPDLENTRGGVRTTQSREMAVPSDSRGMRVRLMQWNTLGNNP